MRALKLKQSRKYISNVCYYECERKCRERKQVNYACLTGLDRVSVLDHVIVFCVAFSDGRRAFRPRYYECQ